jgi:Rrf2 family protein
MAVGRITANGYEKRHLDSAFFISYNSYMRISTRGRYSLEALLYLALLPEGGFASTRAIAKETGVPERYLEQLFIPLRGEKIICGIRGPKGGYYIDKPAAEITVGDILRSVEGPMELVECTSAGICSVEKDCQSRHTWSELYQTIHEFIDSVTLADLVEAYAVLGAEYTI